MIQHITKPFKYPNRYLILKLNGKKEMRQVVDIDKELNEIILELKKDFKS